MELALFEDFYKKNKRSVSHFIFMKIHDKLATEDIVSDVFIKVYKNLDKFDENKASFKTWVYNIAINATIDYLRRKKVQTRSMNEPMVDKDGEIMETLDYISHDANPEEELIANEFKSQMFEAIKKLSPFQQEIMTSYAAGKMYEEIAEELNVPIGTVKGSMHLARIKMRELCKKPVLV